MTEKLISLQQDINRLQTMLLELAVLVRELAEQRELKDQRKDRSEVIREFEPDLREKNN